ncbi:hypothetical protein MMC30_004325 [Trapelia coarctata]|nr:hypothetical protein [Trapelia coarctata]
MHPLSTLLPTLLPTLLALTVSTTAQHLPHRPLSPRDLHTRSAAASAYHEAAHYSSGPHKRTILDDNRANWITNPKQPAGKRDSYIYRRNPFPATVTRPKIPSEEIQKACDKCGGAWLCRASYSCPPLPKPIGEGIRKGS